MEMGIWGDDDYDDVMMSDECMNLGHGMASVMWRLAALREGESKEDREEST